MIPKKFEYYSPDTLKDAIEFLSHNEEAKVIAGGQSLLALMKLRIAAPSALVDISRLRGLSYVIEREGNLALGALTTYDEIERNDVIRERFTLLNDAVRRVGDQQVRNMGTIGGSACHADPAGDFPTALVAAGARFVIEGKNGKRIVDAANFFLDSFSTAVQHDEILTEVQLPLLPIRSATAFMKHSLREADFAIAMVAVCLTLREDLRTCSNARVVMGAVGETPLRSPGAEDSLKDKPVEHKTIMEAVGRVTENVQPPSDVHGDSEYRLEMIRVLTRRSLELAASRVEEEELIRR